MHLIVRRRTDQLIVDIPLGRVGFHFTTLFLGYLLNCEVISRLISQKFLANYFVKFPVLFS